MGQRRAAPGGGVAARLVRHGLEALKGCRIGYLVGSQILSSGSRLFDSSFIFSHTVPYRRPWNYPLFLSLQPIIGAISAGCPALLKPSEIGPGVSSVLADLFPKYLDPSAYRIINGGVPETTYLLKLKWDHSAHDLCLFREYPSYVSVSHVHWKWDCGSHRS